MSASALRDLDSALTVRRFFPVVAFEPCSLSAAASRCRLVERGVGVLFCCGRTGLEQVQVQAGGNAHVICGATVARGVSTMWGVRPCWLSTVDANG